MLTADELDRLERLAKAATPGPWFTADWELDDGPNQDVIEAHEPDVVAPGQRSIWPGGIRHMQIANVRDSSVDDETTAANARLIAACHPQSILSLIEMARQALSPMADALAAGDGTLHGAIDHWQRRATEAEALLEGVSLSAVIEDASARHGSLRNLAAAICVDVGYLSRLARGEKTEPSDSLCAKLGLRRVVTYRHVANLAQKESS